jgi:hypothetical protein
MLSSLIFRVVRNALPDNSAVQEQIIGARLFVMGVADTSGFFHCVAACRDCELTRCFCFAAYTVNNQAELGFLTTAKLTYINSIISTLAGVLEELRYVVDDRNATTDGNVTSRITSLTPVLS